MATNQVDKIDIDKVIHHISPSPDGVNTFDSNDVAQASSTAWTNITTLSSSDTNKSILNKISTMFKNIRFIYNTLGNGLFTTTNTVTNVVNNKANINHSHTTEELPVSAVQIESTAMVPTSAVIYEMNEKIKKLQTMV